MCLRSCRISQDRPIFRHGIHLPSLGDVANHCERVLGGSGAEYTLAALTLTVATRHGRCTPSCDDQTSTVAAWRTEDKKIYLLAGNLEEGLRDGADHSRHISLELPPFWKAVTWSSVWVRKTLR